MRGIKRFVFMIVLFSGVAQAELYRWVDRETGQVKFSNTPPAWFGDPEKQRRNPPVEVIRYRSSAEKPKPTPAAEATAAEARTIASLEARWLELTRFFASLPPGTDLARAGPKLQQQLDTYQAISAELERLDPRGATRRRSQEAAVIDSVRREQQPTSSPRRPAD
jgi:hypothetical protein